MATLQKFKLLATQCAVAGSPSRSPTTSPVFQLRRRKTLRMLFTRSTSSNSGRHHHHHFHESPDRRRITKDHHRHHHHQSPDKSSTRNLLAAANNNTSTRSHKKLKDLFVSSPPFEDNGEGATETVRDNGEVMLVDRRGGVGSPRPMFGSFRYRLLLHRRSWRPVLVTISE